MYRFEEIWGNQRLLSHLRMAVKNQKTSHAYLFIGGSGSGKKMIANTFAKYLLCATNQDEPCDTCESCRVFESGNHPDVIYVTSQKKTLGVDEIRGQILETVDIKPYHYNKKIYIIQHAHTMTVQAQNALLKTLEEPPEYVVFLLLAEKTEAFLPTVLSRMVTLKISPLSEEEIHRYLVGKKLVAPEEGGFFAAYAQGRIGHALELIEDTAFRQMREDILTQMSQLQSMRLSEALLLAKEWEIFKNDTRFLDIIALWYRDLMAAKSLRDERFIIQKDKKDLLYSAAKEPTEILAKKSAAVTKAKERLIQNGNFRLTIEVMLMELKENGAQ
ncbi:DNA polymerase III subunit delta' [Anaerotignum propionicum]|uniref:DNA polymerase III subunit tau n=1 Tax=Anaerotignum propionicum DSM 1682 TaxID=991789 RepID=A0A0X8VDZ8_ANAPI|nr:DNA polymerase III subunit delta' [Anaerotignum propionicum]AMJ42249.1 DNA polymerase III subunit tau [Anaerotignum propionicum DSM 1682]SHE54792.1 DNA polymerase-3 subunit delta' [[Clostridium] propionicum DSM 1682] [Anaerotignum propionicum DSM 1682]